MQTLHRRSWQWHLAQSPAMLWPVIADTARFNEAARLPKYQVEDILQPDGRVLRLARATVGGIKLEWEERPYEWVRGSSFRQTRVFRKGPLRRFGPVVELFLEATRIGVLRLSWDLLCPRCRGAKSSVAALDQLPKAAHCSACNIGYDADFARNVELSFRPAPSVRELTIGEYCLNGPY